MTISEQIFIQIGSDVIELTGNDKVAFIADLEAQAIQADALKAEADAKITARASALAKLAALGLTQDEINAL